LHPGDYVSLYFPELFGYFCSGKRVIPYYFC
jgi:hypothetical protein